MNRNGFTALYPTRYRVYSSIIIFPALCTIYVYVLLSEKDGKFYIGFTSDLKRRVKEHSSGKNFSTKLRRPLKLIYYKAHLSREDAERREKYFKTTKGKSTLRQMLRGSLKSLS